MNDWMTFALDIPVDGIYYRSAVAEFEVMDLSTGQFKPKTRHVCNDRYAVTGLVASLQSRQTRDFMCEGKRWRSFVCKGVLAFCVGCSGEVCNQCPGVGKDIITSCKDCSSGGRYRLADNVASYGWLHIDAAYDVVYPSLSTLQVDTAKDTLTISTTVSAAALVYCGALPLASFNPATLSIYDVVKDSNPSAVLREGGSLSLTITGLDASTAYAVMCHAKDFEGHSMDVEAVANTKVDAMQCFSSYRFLL